MKYEVQFRRPDSEDTIWFGAPAKEQPTLVREQWFHGISFRVELLIDDHTINDATGCDSREDCRHFECEQNRACLSAVSAEPAASLNASGELPAVWVWQIFAPAILGIGG